MPICGEAMEVFSCGMMDCGWKEEVPRPGKIGIDMAVLFGPYIKQYIQKATI
jgi:hypothetical protein